MTINPDALTERELSILQGLLDVNDRGGFYSVLNAQFAAVDPDLLGTFGGDAASLQGRIATFTGPVGGIAFAANRLLQTVFGPVEGAPIGDNGVALNQFGDARDHAKREG